MKAIQITQTGGPEVMSMEMEGQHTYCSNSDENPVTKTR
jgi:hypothetical protein